MRSPSGPAPAAGASRDLSRVPLPWLPPSPRVLWIPDTLPWPVHTIHSPRVPARRQRSPSDLLLREVPGKHVRMRQPRHDTAPLRTEISANWSVSSQENRVPLIGQHHQLHAEASTHRRRRALLGRKTALIGRRACAAVIRTLSNWLTESSGSDPIGQTLRRRGNQLPEDTQVRPASYSPGRAGPVLESKLEQLRAQLNEQSPFWAQGRCSVLWKSRPAQDGGVQGDQPQLSLLLQSVTVMVPRRLPTSHEQRPPTPLWGTALGP